jgi:hypothetical protein
MINLPGVADRDWAAQTADKAKLALTWCRERSMKIAGEVRARLEAEAGI